MVKNEYKSSYCNVAGLCFASLVDFDDDGVDELVVSYHDGTTTNGYFNSNGYKVEVWRYDERGNAVEKVIDSRAFHIGNNSFMNMGLVSINGVPAIVSRYEESTSSLSSDVIECQWYTDGALRTKVFRLEVTLPLSSDSKNIYSVDGNEIDKDSYSQQSSEFSTLCQPLGWTKYTGDDSKNKYYCQRMGYKLTLFPSSDDLNTSETVTTTKKTIAKLNGYSS